MKILIFLFIRSKIFFFISKIIRVFYWKSSSGILEIPFLEIPVINIGMRQKNRYNFLKIFHVEPNSKKIIKKIKEIIKKNKREIINIKKINTSKKISLSIINYLQNSKNIEQKIFYDLKSNLK